MQQRLIAQDRELVERGEALHHQEETLQAQDDSIAQLTAECKDLKVRCATSEKCRSHGAAELRRLRKTITRQNSILSIHGRY